ncbi:hypothetical protein HMPREF3182_01358 [Megasphaera hutchinsoni]|uniref:Uncharacterized protein n=1 Tax=Megasphaera hutchinsoni TaxID=1588748 RepID=A0A134CDV9_9FIRM|nr:hypothetical protein HMPREF3182_01358 [Megasphaera hutchinsoni]
MHLRAGLQNKSMQFRILSVIRFKWQIYVCNQSGTTDHRLCMTVVFCCQISK